MNYEPSIMNHPHYPFTLQPYTTPSSRYRCPQCNHRDKTFVRYICTGTGEQLADHVGRCGREDKCGYHYKPRDYFKDNPHLRSKNRQQPGRYPFRRVEKPRQRPAVQIIHPEDPNTGWHINGEIVNASFAHYERNNFVQYLIRRFGLDAADALVGRYRIGTSKYWPGATVFWQLDHLCRARAGKIMLYNAQTGKRVKEPFVHITWVHRVLLRESESRESQQSPKDAATLVNGRNGAVDDAENHLSDFRTSGLPDFSIQQCFFGSHLLTEEPHKPVAIVESEKTAIIARHFAPNVIWLAAGSVGGLKPELCHALHHRTVTLYPDLGAYAKWVIKARELQAAIPGSVFMVSDLLEQIATAEAREEGWDLGDGL